MISFNRKDYVDINEYCLAQEKYRVEFGWHIFLESQAKAIAEAYKGLKFIEVYAGTGYVAKLITEQMGNSNGSYLAYDNNGVINDWGYVKKHYDVINEDVLELDITQADVIVMCWPAYAEMDALTVVKNMRIGQVLLYQGEGYGGCTGCDEFHEYLESNFHEANPELLNTLNDLHVTWDGLHDRWFIYKKDKE